MEDIIDNWIFLREKTFTRLAKDSNTVHHAAQLLTYAAKAYLPAEEDDSHTGMHWIPEKNLLMGRTITSAENDIRLALGYQGLELIVADDSPEPLAWKSFQGNSHADMMQWLEAQLRAFGLRTEEFNSDLHYQLPNHDTDEGAAFIIIAGRNLAELAAYRTNGHRLLSQFASKFSTAGELLVWPHHFDEGVVIPVRHENDAVTHTLSLGLAVPDTYYNNPYFYVTVWKQGEMNYPDDLPGLAGPGKWHTGDWTGQVLEGRDLTRMKREEQAETAIRFMEQAVLNALEMLND